MYHRLILSLALFQDVTASNLLGGAMQLVPVVIDSRWKPFVAVSKLQELIDAQNSTHVFLGCITVRYHLPYECN